MAFWNRRSLREEYTLGLELGRGQFGVVNVAHRKADGAAAAVKAIERRRADMGALRNEIACMKMIGGHRHVLRLLDSFEDDARFVHLVVELCTVCLRRTSLPYREESVLPYPPQWWVCVVARACGAAFRVASSST